MAVSPPVSLRTHLSTPLSLSLISVSAFHLYLLRFGSGWEPVNVREFERHAQLMLSKNAFDYYASGANDMVTLRENRQELTANHDLAWPAFPVAW